MYKTCYKPQAAAATHFMGQLPLNKTDFVSVVLIWKACNASQQPQQFGTSRSRSSIADVDSSRHGLITLPQSTEYPGWICLSVTDKKGKIAHLKNAHERLVGSPWLQPSCFLSGGYVPKLQVLYCIVLNNLPIAAALAVGCFPGPAAGRQQPQC